MKRFVKIALWGGGIIVLFISLTAVSGWLWSFRLKQVESGASDLAISGDAKVGSPTTASGSMILPLRERIKEIEVIPGKGCAVSGTPEIKWKRYLWSRKELVFSQTLVPLTPGTVGNGTVKIVFRSSDVEPVTWTIPPFEAAALAVTPGAELQLADAMPTEKRFDHRYLWIGLALALLAAGVYLWQRSRNKQKSSPLPPWKRAMERLETLRFELRQRRVMPEQGFARLTDVVRDYIEERFRLPASRRTTAEFLDDLSENNPLPPEQRPFLSDFLSVADQVKFAKAQPDVMLLHQAIDQAEKLISSTGNPEEEKEVKNV